MEGREANIGQNKTCKKKKKKKNIDETTAEAFSRRLKRGKRNHGGFISGASSFSWRRFLEKMSIKTAITKMDAYVLRTLFERKGREVEAKETARDLK